MFTKIGHEVSGGELLGEFVNAGRSSEGANRFAAAKSEQVGRGARGEPVQRNLVRIQDGRQVRGLQDNAFAGKRDQERIHAKRSVYIQ